jgi:ribonucleoside-triphosphate reductase (thioredoxin)
MDNTLPTVYQQYIHKSRYARWLDTEGRRETWEETVDRYMSFMVSTDAGKALEGETVDEIRSAILNLEVMPSMRLLMTAGPAAARCNVGAFNCAYMPVDHPRAFDETLYILMCGTGVGFSVERSLVGKLPEVAEHFEASDSCIVVQDTKAGWGRGLKELLSMLYSGQIPTWDLSKLRPAGARLMTTGGRSSGPGPLHALFEFAVATFTNAKGRRLTSQECHDLMCKIAEIVVVGGVRRSALISLSDLSDEKMRDAKSGNWWEANKQRSLANNSAVYVEKPTVEGMLEEWTTIYKSKSGERGIINREALIKKCEGIGRATTEGAHDKPIAFGTNPCAEIILRPHQFCNLSEVVIRADDTEADLLRKVRIAAIIGTFQASLTDFRYLRPIWKKQCQEEALLGVSLTGIMDNVLTSKSNGYTASLLTTLRAQAIAVNQTYADKFGISESAAVTTVKPSGTVSQLVNASSGIHPRYSPYYVRTVRGDNKDPLTQFMKNAGVPWEACVSQPENVSVFSFPISSPGGALATADNTSALKQLELYALYYSYWADHNVSTTVYMREDEWLPVLGWVHENFDTLAGVAFLPYTDHVYKQAPYQPISKAEFENKSGDMPITIDWDNLSVYELEDNTKGNQEFACTAGVCEVVDV